MNLFKYVLFLAGMILVIEFFLRFFGVASTYSERTYGKFATYYDYISSKPYHTWNPNTVIEYNQTEFNYSYQSNSHGFREIEFPDAPIDSIEVIYVLGDSYVEGDGAPYDSTLTRFLEQKFHNNGFNNVKVFNVGVNGSDPIYQYWFFKNELVHTKPEIVLMITNQTDLLDVQLRGGFERFQPDGGVKFNPAPSGFIFYKYSRIFRIVSLFFGYREGMIKLQKWEDSQYEKDALVKTFLLTDSLCIHIDSHFVLISHSLPGNVEKQKVYTEGILECVQKKSENIKAFNLTDSYNRKTENYDYNQYAWPINGHFNSYGYQLMAEAVYENLQRYYPEIFERLTKTGE
jgi:hypothetical protein